jgi:hypothetical protein
MKNRLLILVAMLLSIDTIAQSTEGNGNNYILSPARYLGYNATSGAFPLLTRTNNVNRMRLNGDQAATINGINTQVNGYLGLGPNGYFNPTVSPWTMLHLEGPNNSGFGGNGWRSWMRTGMLVREESDHIYVGMKNEGSNRSDAIINWSDDAADVDKLRFLFTGNASSGNGDDTNRLNGAGLNGYEFMRMQTVPAIVNEVNYPVGHVGIGPLFTDVLTPQNRLHINAESGLPTYMQISNVASSTLAGTGQTGTDGLKLGMEPILNGSIRRQYGFLQWQENTPFIVQSDWDGTTGGVTAGERLRITSVGALVNTETNAYGGLTTPTNVTRVSVSHNGAAPVTKPLSLMHLGYNAVGSSAGGWRPWMDIGTFTSNGLDHVYVGLKQEGTSITADRMDAVVGWGDNHAGTTGPDNMRFIFTSATGGTSPATGANGLEGMRMTPTPLEGIFTGIGGDAANPYGPAVPTANPTATLEVNSWGTTNVNGGSSGLRFTNLTTISPMLVNPGPGVLAVDDEGDVIYVQGSTGGSGSFGSSCSDTVNGVLAFDTKVDLNNHNLYFTKNDALGQNHVGIGYSCSAALPGKLSVHQGHPAAVNQSTTAIDAHNKDIASVMPLTMTGVKGLVDGVETLPRIEHIGGDFLVRNGQLNFGVRSRINSSQFAGATDYGLYTEINDPNALVTFGTWSVAQGGSNANWGVYSFAAPRTAAQGGSAQGYGGRFGTANHGTVNVGVWGEANDPFPSPAHQASNCFGVAGIAKNGANNYGVYGEAGTSGSNNAGYFTGNVQLTGSPLTVSDAQFKTNVENLPDGLNLLMQLKPKTYFMDTAHFERMNFDRSRQYGFIAQEVAKVLPSLVKKNVHPAKIDSTGREIAPEIAYQTLNYNAIIPINTQAIIELNQKVESRDSVIAKQQTTIDDLNTRLAKLENCLSGILPSLCQMSQSIIETNDVKQQEQLRAQLSIRLQNQNTIVLDQNVPNPFSEQTVINFSIPKSVQKAQILFYNGDGKLIQSVNVAERGLGSLTVFGSDLSSGIYTYTLIADGQVVATKKMIHD